MNRIKYSFTTGISKHIIRCFRANRHDLPAKGAETMKKTTLAVLLAVLVYLQQLPLSGAQRAPGRPTVMTMRGMVASGHPLASEAGLRILKEGGNAVDAAIGAWLVQGQVEPAMTGLGSDMYILIYLAKTGEVKFINGT